MEVDSIFLLKKQIQSLFNIISQSVTHKHMRFHEYEVI